MKRPTSTEEIRILNRAGFRFHKTGSIMDGRKCLSHVYIGDELNDEQRTAIKASCETVTFGTNRPQYAPEQSYPAVIFNRRAL